MTGSGPRLATRVTAATVVALLAALALWPTALLAEIRSRSQDPSTADDETDQAPSEDDPADPAPDGLEREIQILESRIADGEVTLVVAIPTSIGRLTPTADNFGVLEGGQLVDITVGPIDDDIDVVVAIDTSQSMRGEPLAAAKRAAVAFVDGLGADDRVGLVGFGQTVTVHVEPGDDREAVIEAIDALGTSGETALWDGLVTSADLVDGADQPFVVVLSDGENTVGSADQSAAVAAIEAAGAELYAVGIESDETDLVSLEAAAVEAGGQYFDTTDVAELEGLYTDIAGRLDNRYEVSFRSERTDQRELRVSVAVGGGAIATARTVLDGDRLAPAVEPAAPSPVINLPDGHRLGTVAVTDPGLLGSDRSIWIGAGAFFTAFAILGVLMAAPAAQVRLHSAVGADRAAGLNDRLSTVADRLVASRDEEGAIDEALDTAGIDLRPGEFILLALAATAVVTLALSALGGIRAGIIAAPLSALGSVIYVKSRAKRRRRQFADQLVDTLGIMAGALRAGRGITQAIELVSREAPSPTSDQFRRVVFEARVGRNLVDSMLTVAQRMENRELEWVARAVDINRELGGDLTEMLDNVADTIRDRRRIDRQVRALSAEGRASGWVMLALPPVMLLFLMWRTPENAMLLFTHPIGRILFGLGCLGMVAGYFWIRRLVDLKY